MTEREYIDAYLLSPFMMKEPVQITSQVPRLRIIYNAYRHGAPTISIRDPFTNRMAKEQGGYGNGLSSMEAAVQGIGNLVR